ncbi:hypothetical protein DPMN_177043 [Dreissena polymorpha]|uniref:Uncharacterized protein n=1 Tax=Dreissena polymorpha TaxID=45954 RepID=A0A9D4ECI9_DREPO|nr:hypothetical protein DPMN_177043 [Dreissena polymorpha]
MVLMVSREDRAKEKSEILTSVASSLQTSSSGRKFRWINPALKMPEPLRRDFHSNMQVK